MYSAWLPSVVSFRINGMLISSIPLKNVPVPKARRLVLNTVSGRLTKCQLADTTTRFPEIFEEDEVGMEVNPCQSQTPVTRRKTLCSIYVATTRAGTPLSLFLQALAVQVDIDKSLLKQKKKRISRLQTGPITAVTTRDLVLLRSRPPRVARPPPSASP